MFDADRFRKLLAARGLSQSELARRVGVSQASIYRLASGAAYGSKHLHRIARELGTTAAYLAGETDDAGENAEPIPPGPLTQVFMMPVVLPSTIALERMFLGFLRSMPKVDEAALAHGLAMLLPSGLRTLQGRLRYEWSDEPDGDDGDSEGPATTDPVRQRA